MAGRVGRVSRPRPQAFKLRRQRKDGVFFARRGNDLEGEGKTAAAEAGRDGRGGVGGEVPDRGERSQFPAYLEESSWPALALPFLYPWRWAWDGR